jgi:SAM-dependent methyltransferase
MRRLKSLIRTIIESSNLGYRLMLKRDFGITYPPLGRPDAPWANAVLKNHNEVEASIEQVRKIGLPIMKDLPKNWDSLAALDLILETTDRKARVYDAGGELYSMILPWLFLYGYKNIIAENLIFRSMTKRGPILYKHGNITKTTYPDKFFDVITCLSVIEHGVDLNKYFSEMTRILKTGGILITSTDYYETPIDTRGQKVYGCPIHIFTKEEIIEALVIAKYYGLNPISSVDLTSEEKVIHWKEYDLRYTFIIISLRKDS